LETPDDEVASEIARARSDARQRADAERAPRPLPGFAPPEPVAPLPAPPAAPAAELPAPPDATAVNESWRPPSLEGGGLVGALRRFVDRLVHRQLDARIRFDAEQAQFDNALLAYVTMHFAATHRHYDRLIAQHSTRMDEIDQRHVEAQRCTLDAIEQLFSRLDLVLEAAERARLSAETELRRLARRVDALERRLEGPERGSPKQDE
jgi:BMFP domain-containing protein YqiC